MVGWRSPQRSGFENAFFVRQQSLERFCKNAAKISWAHRQPRNHDAKRALESSGAHDNTHARTARPLWTCKAPENRLLCFFDNTVCSFGASFAAACHSSRARHKAPTCCPTCPPSESPAQSPADQSRRASNRQATRRARCPPAWPPAQTPPSRLPAATTRRPPTQQPPAHCAALSSCSACAHSEPSSSRSKLTLYSIPFPYLRQVAKRLRQVAARRATTTSTSTADAADSMEQC